MGCSFLPVFLCFLALSSALVTLKNKSATISHPLLQTTCPYKPVECVDDGKCNLAGIENPPTGSVCLPVGGNGICQCPQDKFLFCTTSKNECLGLPTAIGGSCLEDDHCKSIANNGDVLLVECYESDVPEESPGRCDCSTAGIEVPADGKCWKKAEMIDDPCDHLVQCTANLENAECTANKCICIETAVAHPYQQKCLMKAIAIDDPCDLTAGGAQCTPNLGNLAECLAGLCKCNQDSAVEHPDKSKCLPKVTRGQCEISEQCPISAECVEDPSDLSTTICLCMGERNNATFWDEDALKCDSYRKLNEQCDNPKQCEMLNEAECVVKDLNDPTTICKCKSDTVVENEKCWKVATSIGESCGYDSQCTDKLNMAECVQGQCACLEDAVGNSDGTKCLSKLGNIGDLCEFDSQCSETLGLAICDPVDKKCACTQEAVGHPDGNKCLKTAEKIGDTCDPTANGYECTPKLGDLSVCFEEQCKCSDESVAHPDLTRCLPKAFDKGDECEIVEQCAHFGYAECAPFQLDPSKTVCLCIGEITAASYWDPVSKRCNRYRQLYEECDEDGQCGKLGQSLCLPSDADEQMTLCQCNLETVEDGGKCYKQITDKTTDCEVSAQCEYASSDSSCLPGLDPVNPERMLCGCNDAFVDITNSTSDNLQCLEILSREGANCTSSLQCSAGMTYASCNRELCECDSGYMFLNVTGNVKCFTPKRLGQVCFSPEECRAGVGNHSICNTNNICDCAQNAHDYNNKCYVVKKVGDSCTANDECAFSIHGDVLCDGIQKICRCNADKVADLGGTICRSGGDRVFLHIFLLIITFSLKLFS